MPTENDMTNNVENRYDHLYVDNNTFFADEISRSYSSGINAPTVSSNLLRVYSRNNDHSQGALRVRSSPSSPNRLSRLQSMTQMHKKWPGLSKVNISSSFELALQNSQTSNTSSEFTYGDQLDLPSNHLLPTSAPSTRHTSWKNLQYKEDIQLSSIHNELYPFCKNMNEKVANRLVKQTSIIIEDEGNLNFSSLDTDCSSQKLEYSINKLSSNPINFKKVLRDRYLNSQRSSNTSTCTTFSSTSSSQNMNPNRSKSSFPNESLSSEPEDHNFNLLQDLESQIRQDQSEEYQKKSSFEIYRTRNALSLDLINLTMPKKFRIRSNNSTVSSMSGIEPESDPFSPASTEICSPLLKLNIPYHNTNNKDSETVTRNLIPSSSLSALSAVTETEDFYTKSQESISTQRFFPETMKISDFNLIKSSKSDSICDSKFQNHLTLPNLAINRQASNSTLQSIQINPNSRNVISSSISPTSPDTVVVKISNQSRTSVEPHVYSTMVISRNPRKISNSRSMDHISSFMTKENENVASKSFDTDICDRSKEVSWRQSDKVRTISTTAHLRHKAKVISNTGIASKKISTLTTSANQRQCTVCGRHFNRSDMLARHIRVHTGHKPFECSICGQSFSRSDHLNTHLRIHSGEKPYRCSICSYSACRRDMITRHLRVHKRKGDILTESSSSLVVNINKPKANQHKKSSKVKSQNSLNLDPDHYSDMRQSISSLYRSHSFTDTDQCSQYVDNNNSFSSVSPIDTPATTPRTFANISISISQPTPRSSFSIPMETQNY